MGCDIHLRLEVKPKHDIKLKMSDNKEVLWRSKDKWYNCYCFGYDDCWGDRVYAMFAKLANVRNYNNLEHIELRGFPKDACPQTFNAYTLIVVSDETYEEYSKTMEGCDSFYDYCSESDATKWLLSKDSEEITIDCGDDPYYKDNRFISDPDYHSPNWCTTQEMEECINEIFKDENGNYKGDYIEWVSLLGLMKGYESSGEYNCRAVFWFDN